MVLRSIPGGWLRRLAAIAGLMLCAALAHPAAADRPAISLFLAAAHRSAYSDCGNRSVWAQRLLRNAGFSAVYNVDEGFLGRPGAKGWLGRGLPVEHCVKCQNSVSVKREYVQ